MNKEGQVTIFIILGILIVISIIIYFFLYGDPDSVNPKSEVPENFVGSCVEESLEKAIRKILENGGEISPNFTISYRDLNYTYLCYQADYYQSCYNLRPMLEFQIEEEIRENTITEVEKCLEDLESDLKSKGFEVSSFGEMEYEINILPGFIEYSLRENIIASKEGTSQTLNNFDGEYNTYLHRLIQVTRDVINSEAQFCNFEYNGYMLLYPELDIKRIDVDGSKLYNIRYRDSNENFKFAVRSCAFAPGV